ncbi:hypothetical protein BV20DRAFT_1008565 [Pilatotrama ljubarskyi]|nr:hypothetical protein BV20DRAFT_1008565 [Pilatotrama ljubarskyi]
MSIVATPDSTVTYPDTPTSGRGLELHEKKDTGCSAPPEENGYLTVSDLRNVAPPGWTLHVNPRGHVYWRNARFRVVVDEDLRNPVGLEKASQFCAQCDRLDLTEGLEAHMIGGMDTSFSLFLNHNHCVAGYEVSRVRDGAVRDMSPQALLRARRVYWTFVNSHPSHRPCPKQGFTDAIDALRSYYHEHIHVGSWCIAPFSKQECEDLLDVLHRAKDDEQGLPATAALLGCILRDVYSFRSAEKWGQVNREQHRAYRSSVTRPHDFAPQQSTATRLILHFLIHVPFFGIPQTYLAHVRSASEFRGHLAGLKQNWEGYTHQLVREYSDFILIATVLLSATVGLLTINDIGQASRVAAMLSAFAALGSMTVGVFFVWRHQRNARMPSSFSYLHNARNNALGLSGHALLLSLPPVLLVWSIVGFAAAALAYALQDTTHAATWVMFALFVIVLVAVMAGVYTFSTIWHWQSPKSWRRGLFGSRKSRAEESAV